MSFVHMDHMFDTKEEIQCFAFLIQKCITVKVRSFIWEWGLMDGFNKTFYLFCLFLH